MMNIPNHPCRRVGVLAAFALAACTAVASARAQTSTRSEPTKDQTAKNDQPQKKDADAKDVAAQKTAARKAAAMRRAAEQRGKVTPRPARRSGLTIPEPTVVLKPGEVPAIKFDEPNYDFGRIRAGEDVVHTYWFTNTGNGPLEILRVKPSCGCTTAGAHTKVVQPGETGQIPIKLSTKHGANTITKTVTVNTNIPGNDATVRLTIKGSVWQPVEVAPNNASFGRITQSKIDSQGARKLTIVNNVEGDMKLSNVRSDNPQFKAEVRPIEEGKKYELVVQLVPPLNDGNNRAKITIDTGLKDYPTVDVSAFAYVTSPVDVTPSALTLLPDAQRASSMTRQFYVRSNDGKPFKIKSMTSTSEKLKLTATQMPSSQSTYQLAVEIPADFVPAANETIELETTHPAVQKLTIPVRSRGLRVAPQAAARPTAVRKASPKSSAKSDMKGASAGTKEKKSEEKSGKMTPVG